MIRVYIDRDIGGWISLILQKRVCKNGDAPVVDVRAVGHGLLGQAARPPL